MSTDRAYIVTPKYSDTALLSANQQVSGAPATNLAIARPRAFWRSINDNPTLTIAFPGAAAKSVDTLILGFINPATPYDMFRMRFASSQANLSAAPAYDTSFVSAWPYDPAVLESPYALMHRAFSFPEIAQLWVSIEFSFSTVNQGVDPYVQMGRLILGKRIEPATSVVGGWAAGFDEPVAETVDLGGEESPRPMGAKRSLEARWQNLDRYEHDALMAALIERGSSKDLALVIDEEQTINAMPNIAVGRVKRPTSIPHTMAVGTDGPKADARFSLSLTVSEMAPTEMR